ncbi:MAG: class I SAM-dependent methyltransferase [Steroidobacterales bacterium]
MDPIAKTAYYCCGVRMLDAQSARPICNDQLAERFMDGPARALFARFAHFRGPNSSNAARHRMIDDLLRERLAANPALRVVLIGAGFDTRAFRMQGGSWYELDQPALLARKEELLPQHSAPNRLVRIPIEFGRDSLLERLGPAAGDGPTVTVLEGVSMYLTREQLRATTAVLRDLFPDHTLITDLMTRRFLARYGQALRRRIRELGGDMAELFDDPVEVVASLGYRRRASWSIPGRALEHEGRRFPIWLLNHVFPSLRDGYQVQVFEGEPNGHGH